jgi:hypothetical protein
MVKFFARMAGRMSNNDDVQQAKPAKSQHGEFFAVDWRCVEEATRYGDGTNTAVAYIALARFTSRNQRTTTAGMTAIHTRTGLTRGRADLALKMLEQAGLITVPTKGTPSPHPASAPSSPDSSRSGAATRSNVAAAAPSFGSASKRVRPASRPSDARSF